MRLIGSIFNPQTSLIPKMTLTISLQQSVTAGTRMVVPLMIVRCLEQPVMPYTRTRPIFLHLEIIIARITILNKRYGRRRDPAVRAAGYEPAGAAHDVNVAIVRGVLDSRAKRSHPEGRDTWRIERTRRGQRTTVDNISTPVNRVNSVTEQQRTASVI